MKGSRAIIRRKLSWHTVYREVKGNEENRSNEIDLFADATVELGEFREIEGEKTREGRD